MRDGVAATQIAAGWCFPNAVMQYAVPDLEGLSIDMTAMTAKRDRLLAALEGSGYDVLRPEGTFYLFGRCPCDEAAFIDALADRDVFVMPGSLMNADDYFRISLTASDEMVARALPAFADVAGRIR